jgi:hypothetical protein
MPVIPCCFLFTVSGLDTCVKEVWWLNNKVVDSLVFILFLYFFFTTTTASDVEGEKRDIVYLSDSK